MSLLLLFAGASGAAPAAISATALNAVFVDRRNNRAIVDRRDNVAFVDRRDKKTLGK